MWNSYSVCVLRPDSMSFPNTLFLLSYAFVMHYGCNDVSSTHSADKNSVHYIFLLQRVMWYVRNCEYIFSPSAEQTQPISVDLLNQKKKWIQWNCDVFTRKLLWGPRVCIQTGFINTTADFSLSASKYYTKVPLSKLSFPVGLIITHNSMIRGSLRDHNTCWLCLEQILVFSLNGIDRDQGPYS